MRNRKAANLDSRDCAIMRRSSNELAGVPPKGIRGMTPAWYTQADQAAWDAFVASAPAGTFMHTRRFLGYHGPRFEDRSLVFRNDKGEIRGILPAALSPEDSRLLISHPGATYGGLLLTDRKFGLDALEALNAAKVFLAESGMRRLIYKSVPPHLQRGWRQVDLYALWSMGARLMRRDLWNVVDLTRPRGIDEARRRRLRRARDCNVRVVRDGSDSAYSLFHGVLTQCLSERHAATPVHSLEEMKLLQSLFPDRISLWLALDASGSCLAGEWIFDCGEVHHGQYGAATDAGREQSAQDLLLDAIIQDAAGQGARCFSFGASTQDSGRVFNEGLFRYKASFGVGAVAHDFYELDLQSPDHCSE